MKDEVQGEAVPSTAMQKAAPVAMARDDEPAETALSAILRAAKDPTVSVDKLERLVALHKDLGAVAARRSFMSALARLQEKLPRIAKRGHAIVEKEGRVVRDTPFARYEDIDVAVRPFCSEEGFSFTFDAKTTPQGTTFSCEMSHRDGHSETRYLTLPIDSSGGKNAIQGMGSSVSYARRYLLSMHLNLVTVGEDDDGNGGPKPISAEQVAFLKREMASLSAEGEAPGVAANRESRFLNWLASPSYEEIPQANFERATKFLDEKKRERERSR